ncbi:hypothetical protein IAD21_00220 [Abditibacteriota bacterium]|nr:hypothetical protein IAD21_00220 [Abditibacteriota bacterium]
MAVKMAENLMKLDWYSCDGHGHTDVQTAEISGRKIISATESLPPRALSLSRRQALLRVGMGAIAWATRPTTALADLVVHAKPGQRAHDTLVTVFMRGGADGLNIVVPYGDDDYGRNRPTIGISAPRASRALAERALDLDGFFGLHPALAPLQRLYGDGLMSFVHACGSGDGSRSHFEAMSAMERGLRDDRGSATSGWLARHLTGTRSDHDSPLRAVAFGGVMPDSLRGATGASTLNSLDDFRLYAPGSANQSDGDGHLRRAFAELYGHSRDVISHAGRETLGVLNSLNALTPADYKPENGATYPDSELGRGLKQVALLIKGDVGLEVACLDHGGWDTHVAQTGTGGTMALLMTDLANSLSAFARDMGAQMKRTTVVVMTEFGRRLQENSGLGTDHGRAGVMMLLGQNVVGGKVFAQWPGLKDDQLEPPGDLRVTTDYRDVLSEIVARRLHNPDLATVFPGHKPRASGFML